MEKSTGQHLISNQAHLSKPTLFALIGLLAIVGVVVVLRLFAGGATTLYLVASSQPTQVGDQFQVAVRANSGDSPVNVVQTNLEYPAGTLKFIKVDYTGSSFGLKAEEVIGQGSIKIGRGTDGGTAPIVGDALVATVTFEVTAPGSGVISFANGSALVKSGDGLNLLTGTASGTTGPAVGAPGYSYSVNSPTTPVPTAPTTPVPTIAPTPTLSPSPSADATKPSIPQNLRATPISSSQINLIWSASTDDIQVTGYKVYRGNTQLARIECITSTGTSTCIPTVSFSDKNGLTASTTYNYTVTAYDAAGNESLASDVATAQTLAGSLSTPRLTPTPTGTPAPPGEPRTPHPTPRFPVPITFPVIPPLPPGEVPTMESIITNVIVPIISSLQAIKVSYNGAQINWLTDHPTTSLVEYGLNGQFNFVAQKDELATEHTVALPPGNLTPGVEYQYRVKTIDASGNATTSETGQFKVPGFTVKLKVVGAEGTPLPGASVEVGGRKAIADRSGVATLTDLAPGAQPVRVAYRNQKFTNTFKVLAKTDAKGQPQPQSLNVKVLSAQQRSQGNLVLFSSLGLVLLLAVGGWFLWHRRMLALAASPWETVAVTRPADAPAENYLTDSRDRPGGPPAQG